MAWSHWRRSLVSTLSLTASVFVLVGACAPEVTFKKDHCINDKTDEDETDVDCGGESCEPCKTGKSCLDNEDCVSLICTDDNVCFEPSCDDGLKNGDETARDCGGPDPSCDRCEAGQTCLEGGDCASEVCTDGVCALKCAAGTADCDNDPTTCETTISSDVDNCGGCGEVCNLDHAEATCNQGKCAILFEDGVAVCDSGFGDCNGEPEDGCEVDLRDDEENCGLCDNSCEVPGGPNGEVFGTPLCVDSVCQANCIDPYANCEPEAELARTITCETNTAADPDNCDGCGEVCPEGDSAAVCRNGTCGFSTCPAGTEDCDTTDPDCEADLTSYQTCGNCGTNCGIRTLNIQGDPLCQAGQCNYTACLDGYADCDGDRTNGCETNTQIDPQHCGGCNQDCPPDNVTSATCTSGVCNWTTSACASGYAQCDTDNLNGCETSTNTTANCGACAADGGACSGSHIVTSTNLCDGGECMGTCSGAYLDCDDDLRENGCEINSATDPNNCGGCAAAASAADPHYCSSNHMETRTCGDLSGSIGCNGACQTGYADCNGNKSSDGCEINTNTNADNCGGCQADDASNRCSTDHITRSCASGSCESGVCATGYLDCNNDKRSDGCEQQMDNNHCGESCVACTGLTPTCDLSSGACVTGLVVYYAANQLSDSGHAGDTQISFRWALCNEGTVDVSLTDVSLRYWATLEAGVNSVSGATGPHDDGASYFLIAVADQTLSPGGSPGGGGCQEGMVTVVSSGTNFDEDDDFSRPTNGPTLWTETANIPLYQDDVLVQGNRP